MGHLPSLKGADQEARRINKYLRAARLPTLFFDEAPDGHPKSPTRGHLKLLHLN
jgi:hypothetical protein